MTKDDIRFVEELRLEFKHSLDMVKARLSVENEEKTFSCANIMGALNLVALEYALKQGISPENFVAAMKAAAGQLEAEMTTRTGLFAPKAS